MMGARHKRAPISFAEPVSENLSLHDRKATVVFPSFLALNRARRRRRMCLESIPSVSLR